MSPLARVTVASPSRLAADLVVVGLCEGDRAQGEALPAELARAVDNAVRRAGFAAEVDRVLSVPLGEGSRRVVALGAGSRSALDPRRLESWLGRALSLGRAERAATLALAPPAGEASASADGAFRVLTHLALSAYRFDAFRAADDEGAPRSIRVLPPAGAAKSYRGEAGAARAVAEGCALARDLGNMPPNVATPEWMARRARSVARGAGFKVTVTGPAGLRSQGMGGILAVGGGSDHSPRLVRLEWGRRGPRVALVGKGVTFDTGGISIKPAADMDEMKYDKCGACNVLGAAVAVARLRLPVRLRCYLPLAENMLSGSAYRPGDIVRCYDGTTVEITNTDAEGRLLLADAIALAVEERPDYLVELSTLTGGAVVALGERAAALYCSEDGMASGLLGAAAAAGERLWRMPLWAEFAEEMKGNHADLKNSAGRWGSVCTAAGFLSRFAGGHPRWAHLDIAGPAVTARPRQASGYGVATLVRWLSRVAAGDGGA